MLQTFLDSIVSLWEASGFAALTWKHCLMLCISFVLMYLAIKKGFEPLLLLPIAFGMFLANLPLTHLAVVDGGLGEGLLNVLYTGVRLELFPPLIFLGIGCMTDFGPLIANPKSFLLGAAAQVLLPKNVHRLLLSVVPMVLLLFMFQTRCSMVALVLTEHPSHFQ